jgi:hypothetical protein
LLVGYGLLWFALSGGCGTTREKLATDQLLLSDAVDRAVAHIDFSPLNGEKVYLDTTYLQQIKGTAFVNADYIISSLRQQMLAAGCLLQEKRDEATYIAEARVGALGTDGHDVNYGIPGNNGLTAAASLVTSSMPLPSLPDISLARKTDDSAATKVAVFAYNRETREPVWQSGLSVARSRAQAKWIFGAGPFESGSIYEGTRFAGRKLGDDASKRGGPEQFEQQQEQSYRDFAVYSPKLQDKALQQARAAVLAAQPAAESPAHEPSAKPAAGESQVQKAEYSEE